jgi:2-polyprenyl-3-methyl-5-hydroxy-6-metoxy-1,4-benzoquinol methylase
VKAPELVIPDEIPADALPDLLRNWYLGSRARRHLSRRRFAEVTGRLGRGAGGRALDAGCGWGYNCFLLSRAGFVPYGIDIVQNDFPAARAIARANAYESNLAGADVSALPFGDGLFAAVTAVETLEHVFAPDRRRAVEEIARVIEPRGSLVLSTPNYASIVEWGKRVLVRVPLLQRCFPPMCFPVGDISRDEYHPYRYHNPLPPGEIMRMLADVGFEIAGARRILLVWKNTPDILFPVARLLEAVFERLPLVNRLCSTIVIHAVKR